MSRQWTASNGTRFWIKRSKLRITIFVDGKGGEPVADVTCNDAAQASRHEADPRTLLIF